MIEFKGLHILIAEDDPDDAEIIHESFTKHEAFSKIDVVENGRQLLDLLKDSTVQKPDVILTDINMPILSGIEVLEAICEDDNLSKIPAFVYSTSVNPAYQLRCMQLGTKAFLVKPFNLNEFDEIPDKIIHVLQESTI